MTTSSLWEFERGHISSPAVAPHSNSTRSPSLSSLENLLNHSQGLNLYLFICWWVPNLCLHLRTACWIHSSQIGEVTGTSKSICQIWAHLLSHFLLLPRPSGILLPVTGNTNFAYSASQALNFSYSDGASPSSSSPAPPISHPAICAAFLWSLSPSTITCCLCSGLHFPTTPSLLPEWLYPLGSHWIHEISIASCMD